MKTKTEAKLKKMNRMQVIKEYQKLAAEFRAVEKDFDEVVENKKKIFEENHSYMEDIAALQARCQTLRHQGMRRHEQVVALEHLANGLKMFEMFQRQAGIFDIRNPNVMNRISELLREGPIHPLIPIHVCPMCGKITKVEKGFSGERICEECRKEADWPWEGEIMWRYNEEGKLEGICRGEYRHPDGSAISVKEEYELAK